MVALVHAEPLDVLADELLDELEVVAALGGRGQELRFEQPVEPEQRRVARELVLDQRRPPRPAPPRASVSANTVFSRSSDGYCCWYARSTRKPCAARPGLR